MSGNSRLKKAKSIFDRVAELCYDINYDPLTQELISIEYDEDTGKIKCVEYYCQAIENLVLIMQELNGEVDYETIAEIESLQVELDEEV